MVAGENLANSIMYTIEFHEGENLSGASTSIRNEGDSVMMNASNDLGGEAKNNASFRLTCIVGERRSSGIYKSTLYIKVEPE